MYNFYKQIILLIVKTVQNICVIYYMKHKGID